MFSNMDLNLLSQMTSIGLLFILFATGAYRKSYTTTVYIISIVVSLTCFSVCSETITVIPILVGAMLSLARAIVIVKPDTLLHNG